MSRQLLETLFSNDSDTRRIGFGCIAAIVVVFLAFGFVKVHLLKQLLTSENTMTRIPAILILFMVFLIIADLSAQNEGLGKDIIFLASLLGMMAVIWVALTPTGSTHRLWRLARLIVVFGGYGAVISGVVVAVFFEVAYILGLGLIPAREEWETSWVLGSAFGGLWGTVIGFTFGLVAMALPHGSKILKRARIEECTPRSDFRIPNLK